MGAQDMVTVVHVITGITTMVVTVGGTAMDIAAPVVMIITGKTTLVAMPLTFVIEKTRLARV